MAYSTLSLIKAYLGIESSNTTEDTLLSSLLSYADSIINEFTGNVFETNEETRYFDYKCVEDKTLYLDTFLQTVTTILNGDGEEVITGSYILLPRNYPCTYIRLKSDYSWEFDDINDDVITVTGDFSYSATPPDDIVFSSIRLTSYLYRQKDNHNDLDRTVAVGQVTLLPAQLPNDVLSILKKYRKVI